MAGKLHSTLALTAVTIALTCLSPSAAQAQSAAPVNLDLVSSVRVSRTTWDYTYRLRVTNTWGTSVGPTTLRASSLPAGVTAIDAAATIDWTPQTGDGVSTDTVTFRQDRTIPFSPSSIVWDVYVTGRFRDSSVSGLSYSYNGGPSALTDSFGRFTVLADVPVTFSVGAVILGTSVPTIQEDRWPMDLVLGGNATSTRALNITRFLRMLDVDGNPGNGIQISAALRSAAAGWTQPDFDTGNLPAELASIVVSAQAADGGAHFIPSAAAALSHLQTSYYCMRSGVYTGTANQTVPTPMTGRGAIVNQPSQYGAGFYVHFSSHPGNGITFLTGGLPGYDQTLNGSFTGRLDFTPTNSIWHTGFFFSSTSGFTNWFATPPSFPFYMGDLTASRPRPLPQNWYRATGTTNDQTTAIELHLQSLTNGAAVSGFLFELVTGTERAVSGTVIGNTVTATATGGVPITATLPASVSSHMTGSMVLNGASRNFQVLGCIDN